MQLIDTVRNAFIPMLKKFVEDPSEHTKRITATRDSSLGDFQANLAMPLAKQLGRDAVELANAMAEELRAIHIFESVAVAGKGFINVTLRTSWLEESIATRISDERLGIEPANTPQKFVIDFSSPNVAKPMHVGHIRSTVIGDALARTLRFLGHQVITDNHLGDWGTQFGMVIFGYKNFVDQHAFEKEPVTELGRLYKHVQAIISYQNSLKQLPLASDAELKAKSNLTELAELIETQPEDKKLAKRHKQAEKAAGAATKHVESIQNSITTFESSPLAEDALNYPDLESKCLQETVKLHTGDRENLDLWKRFMPLCMEEIHSVYRRLDIQFDHEYGESFYHDQLADCVRDLVDQGLAVESDGAICVFLENFDAPMIIQKRDGAFLYATTDLATVAFRKKAFDPTHVLYVVDHRQSEHFAKLFATCRTVGFDTMDLVHVSFGTVLGKDGKPFKTRSGSTVGLNPLLDESIQRATEVVQQAKLDLPADEQAAVAEAVGLGAIKYADLSHNRTSDYVFDMEKMVQLIGDTSAYIQYSYARTRSILRKVGVPAESKQFSGIPILLQEISERDLGIALLRFEESLWQCAQDYYPNFIANALYDLAKSFASFYDQCPVLSANDEVKQSRAALVFLTGETLRMGLNLLGIRTVERM